MRLTLVCGKMLEENSSEHRQATSNKLAIYIEMSWGIPTPKCRICVLFANNARLIIAECIFCMRR